jgi:DNA-binding NarL/FixJ family response regulator
MNEFNQKMQQQVSEVFLSQYFGLNASQIRVIKYLNDGFPPTVIAEKMKSSIHNVNFHKRQIIDACKGHLGNLKDARQCVDFLCKMFTF